MSQIIEVTISASGEAKIETKGFSGSQCRAVSRSLELAIGQPECEHLTGEFHSGQQTHNSNSVQQ